MNEFIFKNHSEIVEEILVDFANELGVGVISNASDIAIKAKVLANQIEGLYYNQDYLLRQAFLQTATGESLDKRAYIFNKDRKKATKAKGIVRMGRATPLDYDITIKKGTMFSTQIDRDGDTITGITTEDAIISTGNLYVDIQSEAESPGVSGNVSAGEFSVLNAPPIGIEYVINLDPFSGGTDEEDDETFRKRVLESIRRPSLGGTKTDYENWALEVEGVTLAKCLPLNRGPGTVDILVGTSSELPSDELVQAVGDHIENKRPIGADIRVLKPEIVNINITVQISPSPGYTVETLQNSVSKAVTDYINSVEVGGIIKVSALINVIYEVKGVDDISILEPQANVELTGIQIARVGVIDVQ